MTVGAIQIRPIPTDHCNSMQYSLLCLTKYYHAVPGSVTSADQCASLLGQSSEIHLRYGLIWYQEVYFDHTLTVIDWHSASIHGVLRLL